MLQLGVAGAEAALPCGMLPLRVLMDLLNMGPLNPQLAAHQALYAHQVHTDELGHLLGRLALSAEEPGGGPLALEGKASLLRLLARCVGPVHLRPAPAELVTMTPLAEQVARVLHLLHLMLPVPELSASMVESVACTARRYELLDLAEAAEARGDEDGVLEAQELRAQAEVMAAASKQCILSGTQEAVTQGLAALSVGGSSGKTASSSNPGQAIAVAATCAPPQAQAGLAGSMQAAQDLPCSAVQGGVACQDGSARGELQAQASASDTCGTMTMELDADNSMRSLGTEHSSLMGSEAGSVATHRTHELLLASGERAGPSPAGGSSARGSSSGAAAAAAAAGDPISAATSASSMAGAAMHDHAHSHGAAVSRAQPAVVPSSLPDDWAPRHALTGSTRISELDEGLGPSCLAGARPLDAQQMATADIKCGKVMRALRPYLRKHFRGLVDGVFGALQPGRAAARAVGGNTVPAAAAVRTAAAAIHGPEQQQQRRELALMATVGSWLDDEAEETVRQC